MAQPIVFNPPLRNPRAEAFHELQDAPQRHAEAMLDVYTILQLLRDKGILEVAKGMLGSGEKILQIATGKLETEEVVRAIRNLTILFKALAAIEPEALERMLGTVAQNVTSAKTKEPPGLLRLLGILSSRDSRRVLAPMAAAMETAGRNLGDLRKTKPLHNGERKKVMRHSA